MLACALTHQLLIGQVLAERNEYEEYQLTAAEWRLVACFVWLLKPMKQVSTAMGGSKYVTLSFAWTSMRALSEVLLLSPLEHHVFVPLTRDFPKKPSICILLFGLRISPVYRISATGNLSSLNIRYSSCVKLGPDRHVCSCTRRVRSPPR